MDLVIPDPDPDPGWALRIHVCDSRGGEGWLELSYDEITSMEELARGLHKLWAHHAWRRERRYGLEYDITSPWPGYKARYFGLLGDEVFVGGMSLGYFQVTVTRVCMSLEHVRVHLLENLLDGGQREYPLGRFSPADQDSYVGMATWLHRLWGSLTRTEIAPGTLISSVADAWPGYRVRMMSRDDEREMNQSTVDFQDCVLKLDAISTIRREDSMDNSVFIII